jgi:ABC-type transport system involved in multi-copper enzyme maturation permease subunit
MTAVWVIAENTFKENVRNRVVGVILLVAVGLILLSSVVSQWSLEQQVKILKDFGLVAVSIFGLLIAMFVGVRAFHQEIERKTIYMLASKPITRWQIIAGKYAGLAATIILNVLAISMCLLAVNFFVEGRVAWSLIPAIGLIALEVLLIVAWSIFFSTITSSILSSIMTFVIYVMGHMVSDMMLYTKLHPDSPGAGLLTVIHAIVPNLDNFNIKTAVVEGLSLPPNTIVYAVLYGMAYIVLVLTLSAIIFHRKELQ